MLGWEFDVVRTHPFLYILAAFVKKGVGLNKKGGGEK